jgi:transposase-like protein
MGKDKNIERLRCTCCGKNFSSNQGTLREKTKITEQQQTIMLKCFRWGVPETGIADIAEVNIKTVHLFQAKL